MKFSKSVFSILLLSLGLTGTVNASSKTTCIDTTSQVELTEDIIASVIGDVETGAYFDPSLEAYVEVKQQSCVTNTKGLYTAPSAPGFSQDGDTRVVKQLREGVTHVWDQVFHGGNWVTVKYSYHKPFSTK